MSIRTPRGLHATLAMLVAAACMIVGLMAVMATTATASNVPCPSGEFRNGDIDAWDTVWPPPRTDGRGVTMCEAFGGPFNLLVRGYLQIVDLEAGARIRLLSQADETEGEPWDPVSRTLFEKRTAQQWYEWIEN